MVELKNRDELTGYIRGLLFEWPRVKAEADLIKVERYVDGGDVGIAR